MHRLYKRNKSFPQPSQLLLNHGNLGLFSERRRKLFTNCEYPKTFSIFAVSIQKQMDTVKIDIELPSCGYYSKEELTDLIYSYALSLVLPDSVSDMSVEDELKELKRRAAEMDSNPSVCIPHEEVYERVMSRLHRYENHLA